MYQLGCEARQRGGERKASSVILSHLSSSFPPSQPEGLDSRPELHMTEEWLTTIMLCQTIWVNLSGKKLKGYKYMPLVICSCHKWTGAVGNSSCSFKTQLGSRQLKVVTVYSCWETCFICLCHFIIACHLRTLFVSVKIETQAGM